MKQLQVQLAFHIKHHFVRQPSVQIPQTLWFPYLCHNCSCHTDNWHLHHCDCRNTLMYEHTPDLRHQTRFTNFTCVWSWRLCGITPYTPNNTAHHPRIQELSCYILIPYCLPNIPNVRWIYTTLQNTTSDNLIEVNLQMNLSKLNQTHDIMCTARTLKMCCKICFMVVI
jgi:hypothetical protein